MTKRGRERDSRQKKKIVRDESDWWYVIGAIEEVSHGQAHETCLSQIGGFHA